MLRSYAYEPAKISQNREFKRARTTAKSVGMSVSIVLYQQQILTAADMKDKPAPPWQTRIASLSLEVLVWYRWPG